MAMLILICRRLAVSGGIRANLRLVTLAKGLRSRVGKNNLRVPSFVISSISKIIFGITKITTSHDFLVKIINYGTV